MEKTVDSSTLHVLKCGYNKTEPEGRKEFIMNVTMIYSEERGSWNVFNGDEWYFESKDYEQANEVYERLCWSEDYDYESLCNEEEY